MFSVFKGWPCYIRLFLKQLQDDAVPLRERWLRGHYLGKSGRLIVNGPPYSKRQLSWIKWDLNPEKRRSGNAV